ncbi:MAG: fumarylacetoacetate hydrolase family protein [Pseudomonadota bacterium]
MQQPSRIPPAILGTVYGVILNDRVSLERMGDALQGPPYASPPRAPVLYIKPANTITSDAVIALPAGASRLEIGATLGLVIGADAARLDVTQAAAAVAAIVPVADLSLPHSSYYRPAIQEKCFDRSCVFGSALSAPADLSGLAVETRINGELVDTLSLADLVRGVPELLRDVTEFMTLRQGDVLLVGVKWQAPTAGAGDRVCVAVTGFPSLEFSISPTTVETQA